MIKKIGEFEIMTTLYFDLFQIMGNPIRFDIKIDAIVCNSNMILYYGDNTTTIAKLMNFQNEFLIKPKNKLLDLYNESKEYM
jgi:hypothetical protein